MPWTDPNSPGWVKPISSPSDWDDLLSQYSAGEGSPLAQVFKTARSHRCRTVVIENRYVDMDYRSEYSAFWSERFPSYPAFAQRLHFFRKTISEHQLHRLPSSPGYIGYSIVRPFKLGRVGRTVLCPPPRLSGANWALATDNVSLFGNDLQVRGAPFCEQDGEFLRCAHAAAWMCHYHASRRRLVGRLNTADLAELPPTMVQPGRSLPSQGLTLSQIQAMFGATGQPALFYGFGQMPKVGGVDNPPPVTNQAGQILAHGYWDTRIFSIICRYLNAGFPVLIATKNHAFTLVGWFNDSGAIRFIACDDQRGPYEVIKSPFTDRRAPWQAMMVPLPPKVYLSGEMAENRAYFELKSLGDDPADPPIWRKLTNDLLKRDVSLRTFLRSNHAYKRNLMLQGRPEVFVEELRLARLPHWVWVVEAHDRKLRESGKDSVVAELVFDSTSSDLEPELSAFSPPNALSLFPPDGGDQAIEIAPTSPWKSHMKLAALSAVLN